MKKILCTITALFLFLSSAPLAMAYSDDYLSDIPKPTRRDMHYFYANRGKVPTPKIRAKGHFIILEARNTYAPSVSKAKNRRHYHRVVGNNYNSLYN